MLHPEIAKLYASQKPRKRAATVVYDLTELATWDESQHPRDHGKFAEKEGESTDESKEVAAPAKKARKEAEKQPWQQTKKEILDAAPPIPEVDDWNIEQIAECLRDAVTGIAGTSKDMCISAALAIKAVYPDAEIWTGKYLGEPHVLAMINGKLIDVTADQFHPKEDTVKVLDLDDLPREYHRYAKEFDNVTYEGWPHSKEIEKKFREKLEEYSKDDAEYIHGLKILQAHRDGKKVPAKVLRGYPRIAKEIAANQG